MSEVITDDSIKSNYAITNLQFKDIKYFVDMLDSQWDLGKRESQSKGKICALIYFFQILIYSKKIIVYKQDNRTIGFAGYDKWNYSHKMKPLYKLIKQILMLSHQIKNKEQLKKYYKLYDYVPKQINKKFDGELAILIIDKNFRGYGIGHILFNEICQLAKKDGLTKIKIETDESCNVNFYIKNNCKKIYETILKNGEKTDKEQAFVFEKNI